VDTSLFNCSLRRPIRLLGEMSTGSITINVFQRLKTCGIFDIGLWCIHVVPLPHYCYKIHAGVPTIVIVIFTNRVDFLYCGYGLFDE